MPNTREKWIESLEESLNHYGTGREMRFVGGDTPCLTANGVTVQNWIPVTERLPESGVHVLVACEMRGQYFSGQYVCDGYYAKAKTQPSYGHPDECAVEYSEEDDEYYLLEGWYEVIKNWDDYNSIVIDDFVTHWMPLPEPSKGE